jgi:hypothetical protein
MRWDPYLMLNGSELTDLWKDHFGSKSKKLLYILGKGFDVRMNLGISSLLEISPDTVLDVLLINFTEGENSQSLKYKHLVEGNLKELYARIGKDRIRNHSIKTWEGKGREKRRVGDRRASEIFKSIEELEEYSDIIVDISSLPRGIYFSLIGKLLALIDRHYPIQTDQPNLIILTAENAVIDSKVREHGIDEELHYQFGFGGGVERESLSLPTIWLPILGEGKVLHFDKAYRHIRPDEICPLLPFPAKNPRRSDDIFAEHQGLFVDVLGIEPQNIIYVPEQNPFEVYRKLVNTVKNYQDSLSILNGCKAVISSFSSKLLSIGSLLAAYEAKTEGHDLNIGILNVDSQGYEIEELETVNLLNQQSELFVIWLTGIPYQ